MLVFGAIQAFARRSALAARCATWRIPKSNNFLCCRFASASSAQTSLPHRQASETPKKDTGHGSSEQKTNERTPRKWTGVVLGCMSAMGIIALAYQGSVVQYIPGKANFRHFDRQIFSSDVKQVLRKVYGHAAGSMLLSAVVCVITRRFGKRVLETHALVKAITGQIVMSSIVIATQNISPMEHLVLKYTSYACYSIAMGVTAACWASLPARAGLLVRKALVINTATCLAMCLIVMNSPSDTFLWLAGPVSIPLSVLVGKGVCGLVFPATPVLWNVLIYTSATMLGALVLLDTTARLDSAEEACKESFHAKKLLGVEQSLDVVNEALGLYSIGTNAMKRVLEICGIIKADVKDVMVGSK